MPEEGAEVPVDLRDIETRKQEVGNFKREHLASMVRHSEEKLNTIIELTKKANRGKPWPEPDGIPQLGLYRMSPDAILPTRATKHSACWDIYSIQNVMLSDVGLRNNFRTVKTGWRLVIPEGYRIDVRARSGMAAKQGVTVLNAPGTIDHDYKGELMIILGSVNGCNVTINKGDRIAQIALERVQEFTVEEVSELPVIDSDRAGGLGSTGS